MQELTGLAFWGITYITAVVCYTVFKIKELKYRQTVFKDCKIYVREVATCGTKSKDF
mgnify:CR=1 FL=1